MWCVDGWMGGETDGWMDILVNRKTDTEVDRHTWKNIWKFNQFTSVYLC